MPTSDKIADNKKLILEAARDGKTLKEILTDPKIRKRLHERQLRAIIKEMVDQDRTLIDMHQGQRGQGRAHKYVPRDQVASDVISENTQEDLPLTPNESELATWLREGKENVVRIGESKINVAGSVLMLMRLTREDKMMSLFFSAYLLQEAEHRPIRIEENKEKVLELDRQVGPVFHQLEDIGLLSSRNGIYTLTLLGERMADVLITLSKRGRKSEIWSGTIP